MGNIVDNLCETTTMFDPSYMQIMIYSFYKQVLQDADSADTIDEDIIVQKINDKISGYSARPATYPMEPITIKFVQLIRLYENSLNNCLCDIGDANANVNRKRKLECISETPKKARRTVPTGEMKQFIKILRQRKMKVQLSKQKHGDCDIHIQSEWADEYQKQGVFVVNVLSKEVILRVINVMKQLNLETFIFYGAHKLVAFNGTPLTHSDFFSPKVNALHRSLIKRGIVMVSRPELDHHVLLPTSNMRKFGNCVIKFNDASDIAKVKPIVEEELTRCDMFYKHLSDVRTHIMRKRPWVPSEHHKMERMECALVEIPREDLAKHDVFFGERQLFRVTASYRGVKYFIIRGFKRMSQEKRDFIFREDNIDCFFNARDGNGYTSLCRFKTKDDDEESDPDDYYFDEYEDPNAGPLECNCSMHRCSYEMLPILITFQTEKECTAYIQREGIAPTEVAIFMNSFASKTTYILACNWKDLTVMMKNNVKSRVLCYLRYKDTHGRDTSDVKELKHSSRIVRLVVDEGKIVGDLTPPPQAIQHAQLAKEIEEKRIENEVTQTLNAIIMQIH